MAASVGGLGPLILTPLQLTAEGGFLRAYVEEKAPGTVQHYLLALRHYCNYASARKLHPLQETGAVLSQITDWQSSLRKAGKEHDQRRRQSDEKKVEDLLSLQAGEETQDVVEGRALLSGDGGFQNPTQRQFTTARGYLVYQTLRCNAQRSGAVVRLTWAEVDAHCLEDGHRVVRTYNKTLGSMGMSNLVFDEEQFRMLQRYLLFVAFEFFRPLTADHQILPTQG